MEAGSESQETQIQFQRESTTPETIYLHNNIPANPFVESDALDSDCDDTSIPVIPLEVINDESTPDDTSIPLDTLSPKLDEKQEVGTPPLLQRDVVIGVAVALVALIKAKEPGSQIDLELLIQLLRNPGMLEQLLKEHGLSASQSLEITCAQPQEKSPVFSAIPSPARTPQVTENLGHSTWSRNMIDQVHRNLESQSNGSMPMSNFDVGKVRKLINEYGVAQVGTDSGKPRRLSLPRTIIKDADYYRRLVSQHGMIGMSPVEARPQEVQPCVYFNSPKGCRRGSSCRFKHMKVHMMEPGAKRMKHSGGTFARHT